MMLTKLTEEELEIFNSLIPLMPINQEFSIFNLHCIHILQPLYITPETRGSGEYDKVRNDFTARSVYSNITKFMLERGFATPTRVHNNIQILTLTDKGEILVAHGDFVSFSKSMTKSPESEIISRIPILIERLPPHGEFDLTPDIPNMAPTIIDGSGFLNPNNDIRKQVDIVINDSKEEAKRIQRELQLEEDVLQYLVSHGFAINRHDIQVPNKIYRQLTDKGRELKLCGSMEAYNQLLNQKKAMIEAEALRQATERQRSDNEYERNKYLFWITASIAIATAVQGAWYLLDLVRNYYNPLFPVLRNSIPFLLLLVILLIISVLKRKVPKAN